MVLSVGNASPKKTEQMPSVGSSSLASEGQAWYSLLGSPYSSYFCVPVGTLQWADLVSGEILAGTARRWQQCGGKMMDREGQGGFGPPSWDV